MNARTPKKPATLRKLLSVALALAILFVAASGATFCYFFGYAQPFDPGFSDYHPSVPASLDEQTAAKELINAYLSHFNSWAASLGNRLSGYKVNEIEIFADDEAILEGKDGFVFTVSYDVHMAVFPGMDAYRTNTVINDWETGNGDIAPGNWVMGKGMHVIVEKQADQYVLASMGTGF